MTVVPRRRARRSPTVPPACARSRDLREAEPGSLADRLGGEEGSNTLSSTSSSNADAGIRDGDGDVITAAVRLSARARFVAEIVTMPPSGIASRALIDGLSSAISSSLVDLDRPGSAGDIDRHLTALPSPRVEHSLTHRSPHEIDHLGLTR